MATRTCAGESGLVHAATGTGKTLAAWWGPLLEWLVDRIEGTAVAVKRAATPPLRVLWITPLRALAADTLESLALPVDDLGIPWTLESRTGDTIAGGAGAAGQAAADARSSRRRRASRCC